jgi:hypothetical protein
MPSIFGDSYSNGQYFSNTKNTDLVIQGTNSNSTLHIGIITDSNSTQFNKSQLQITSNIINILATNVNINSNLNVSGLGNFSNLNVIGLGNFNNLKVAGNGIIDTVSIQTLSNKILDSSTLFPNTIVDTFTNQTLSNKTLDSSTLFPNTIVDTSSLQSLANKTLDSSTLFPNTIVDTTSTQTLANKTLDSSTIFVLPSNIVDTTSFQTLSNKTLSSNIIFPSNIVDTTSFQTLSNKTLSSNIIFPSNIVDTTSFQTLSNKTLSTNTIFPSNIVDTTSFQTLSNKTLDSSTIFVLPSNIVNTTSAQTLSNKTLSTNTIFPNNINIGIGTPSISNYNLEVHGSTYTSNLSVGLVTSSLIPDSNITYDLGSSNNRWRDLYLHGNTIYLGSNTIKFDPSSNNSIKLDTLVVSGLGINTIPTEGLLKVDGNVEFTSTNKFIINTNDVIYTSSNVAPNIVFNIDATFSNGTIFDTNKKIYKTGSGLIMKSSDSIKLQDSGDNTQFILNNSTGNVGIGTTNPLYTLDVAGKIRTQEYRLSKGIANTEFASYTDDNGFAQDAIYLARYSCNIHLGSPLDNAQNVYLGSLSDSVNVGGILGVTGSATLSNTLKVNGTTTLSTLSAGTTTLSALGVTSSAILSNLSAGATTLNSTLAVTGITLLNSALGVTGTTTLSTLTAGTTALSNTLLVSGATTLSTLSAGTTILSDTLGVTGNTTLNSNLNVNGIATLQTANITGNLNIGGTLNYINADHILVQDKVIQLASTTTGLSNLTGSGIIIGSNSEVSILYNDSISSFAFNKTLNINSTDAITIPSGTTAQRPTANIGMLRYNSTTSQFEGYGSNVWATLGSSGGGVIDLNQDTYISAETSPGINNDQLKFFTSNVQRMIIDRTGYVGIGTTNPQSALHIFGPVSYNPSVPGIHMGFVPGTSNRVDIELCVADSNGDVIIDFTTPNMDSIGRIYYSFPTNYMSFNTSGIERLRIDSTGLVLGLNQPQQLTFGHSGTTAYGIPGSTAGTKVNLYPQTIGSTSINDYSLGIGIANDLWYNVPTGGKHSFTANGTEAVSIQYGGIVINNPGQLNFGANTRQMVNLYGTIYGMGIQTNTFYYRTASQYQWYQGGIHSDTQDNGGSGGISLMQLDTNGSLTVRGNLNINNTGAQLNAPTSSYGSINTSGGTRNGYAGYVVNNTLALMDNGSYRGVYIHGDDWIIVKNSTATTTIPAQNLNTNTINCGTINSSANAVFSGYVRCATTVFLGTNTLAQGASIQWNAGSKFGGQNGNTVFQNSIGLGTGGFEWWRTSDNSTYTGSMYLSDAGNLQIAGNTAYKSAGTTWTVGSDLRIKENIIIADYDRCYDIMSNLDLKRYKYRDDIQDFNTSNLNDTTRLGWIADEVELYYPKAVIERDQYGFSNFKSLDVDQIYACMYGTIKKLINENENLKINVNEIIKENKDLKSNVDEINNKINFLYSQYSSNM